MLSVIFLNVFSITSEPDIDPLNVDWRQDSHEKSIRDVVNAHREDEANSESDDETETADLPIEIDTATLTTSEAIRRLDQVKQFAEVYGDNDLKVNHQGQHLSWGGLS